MKESGVKTAELYPAPANLKAYTALAFSDINNWSDPWAWGFLRIPILANWFPVIKSGFSESFSKRAYANAFNAPNSR